MHFSHIGLPLKLPFGEDVSDMTRDNGLISLKEIAHLGLGQPDRLFLHPDLEGAGLSLVDGDFACPAPLLHTFSPRDWSGPRPEWP